VRRFGAGFKLLAPSFIMKLPDKIKGRHKVRDAKICYTWIEELDTFQEIAEKFGLTERRVRQILVTNHSYLPLDREWEKKKRIHALKLSIKKSKESSKDRADLLLQLKHELEGEKPLIHIGHNQFFNDIIAKPKLKNRVEEFSGSQN